MWSKYLSNNFHLHLYITFGASLKMSITALGKTKVLLLWSCRTNVYSIPCASKNYGHGTYRHIQTGQDYQSAGSITDAY